MNNTTLLAKSASIRRAWLWGALGLLLGGSGVQAEDGITPLADTLPQAVVRQGTQEALEAPAQLITKIEVRPEDTQVLVVVKGDGKLFHEVRRVDNQRVVLDLPVVASALKTSVIAGQHPLLKRVRVGVHADKVRLVLDVADQPACSVVSTGSELVVTLKSASALQASGEIPKLTSNETGESSPSSLDTERSVRLPRGMDGELGKFKIHRVQLAGGAPAQSQTDEVQTHDVVAGQTHYVGRRVSLDFQQADITNILRLIAEVSGFNIVVGEGIKTKVTMKLVNVPWDQALDMLLKMNGLGMIRQGSIVWVDTLANIAKQQDEEAKAKESKVKAEALVDRVFYIRNLPAQELMTSLIKYLSPRGVMTVSQGSNALIVRETESKLGVLKQLVDGLDLQVPQVQIEARIVQADTVYARGLGIQWGVQNADFGANSFSFFGNSTGAFAPVGGTSSGGTAASGSIARDFIVNLPAQVGGLPSVPAIGYQFGKLAPGFALDLRLSAGELLGLTKVIAAPKVTTLDKREAKISQGESIPFQTTSLQGTQTTFVDANLELNVTPQITSRDPKEIGKQILMKVRATRNSVGARSNPAGPSIDRREATTQVIVRDGETMVIGGVFVDTQGNNVQGVPYLSRIPVIGWLFKNKSETVSKQELLIFLTPSIMRTT